MDPNYVKITEKTEKSELAMASPTPPNIK